MPGEWARDYEISLEDKLALARVTWKSFTEKVAFKWVLKKQRDFNRWSWEGQCCKAKSAKHKESPRNDMYIHLVEENISETRGERYKCWQLTQYFLKPGSLQSALHSSYHWILIQLKRAATIPTSVYQTRKPRYSRIRWQIGSAWARIWTQEV